MANDLNFHKAYTPPAGNHVDLNFSLNPDGVATNVTVSLAVSPPTLHIETAAAMSKPVVATVTLTLTTVQTLHIVAGYDNRVFRGPSKQSDPTWQEAQSINPLRGDDYQSSQRLRTTPTDTWQPAAPLSPIRGDDYVQAARLRAQPDLVWERAAPTVRPLQSSPFQYALRLRNTGADSWQEAARRRRTIREQFQYPPHIKVSKGLPWHEAKLQSTARALPFGRGTFTPISPRLPWQEARRPGYGAEGPPVVPPVEPPFEGDPDLNFRCLWLDYAGNDILLNFAVDQCPPAPPGDTVIVPVKRVYIVLNTTSLRRVDGNVLLPTFSLSLSIDADSWTWGFNASLPDTTLDAIEPGSDGTPVELEAIINGTAYRVLAEQISRDRTFGRSAIRVSGKGKSAILGAPYAQVQNFSNSSAARTAQQLVNDALTVNGASIGWTVNWAATDWLVPASAWSHQGSYISALNAIAGAAGAYIQPHPSQKTLNVLSRYPTAPWNWGSLVPDFELPADVTTRESIEWLERPRYNRVFVSGQGQGVLGQVTRGGTAGDIVAPMVTDALITHADAARQRGLAVLGDTGRQAHLSLRLPVLEETGVIQPGKFVRYVDGGVTRIGIVRSTSVDVSNPEVWQTIGVETHVATA
ncbi:hypothetical protein [Cupriavidus necator]